MSPIFVSDSNITAYQAARLALFRLGTRLRYYVNSADPVQTPQNAASELGQHCLLTEISMENTVKMKASTWKANTVKISVDCTVK